MTSKGEVIVAVKRAIKEVYAWPGAYPLFIVCRDGGALCVKCAKKNIGLIAEATAHSSRDGWAAAGVDINWEDRDLHCDNCCKRIESAYG